jgi:hypothetical protein
MEMRIPVFKWTHVFVTGLMLAWGAAANAQQPAPRVSVNVQSPFFNPFDVGASRLQLDMFGSFELRQSTASSLGSIAAASSVSARDSKGGDEARVAAGKVRKPNKPPKPRSPHKPPHPHDPPGPPFDPPGPPPDRPPVNPPGHQN